MFVEGFGMSSRKQFVVHAFFEMRFVIDADDVNYRSCEGTGGHA